jgi:predicted amidohydrolase
MKSFALLFLLILSACSTPSQERAQKISSEVEGVRVASLNYRIEGGKNLDEVIQHLERFVAEAGRNKAKYILLPELIVLDLFPVNPSEKEVKRELERVAKVSDTYVSKLKDLSAKHNLSILGASFVVKKGANYINRAVYIKPNKDIVFQDKVHPTPWEIRYGFRGASTVKTLKSEDFSFAILICHDAEFPEISSSLIFKRPEVLFVPSQTDDKAGLHRVLYTSTARAIEHMSYVLMTGASSLDEAPWHSYQGMNIFIQPQNKYFTEGYESSQTHEELSYYDLNLERLREARKDLKQVYPARDSKRIQ